MKQRTCKICKQKFTPDANMFLPPTCSSYECRTEYAMKHLSKSATDKKKQANKLKKEFNENDRKYLIEIAQKTCNTYIRMRDKDEPCVSCGVKVKDGMAHASHFKAVGSYSYLRFDESNIHKSCSKCNVFLNGNLNEYRIRIVERIGQEELDRLDKPNELKKWDIDEIKKIIYNYRKKIKEL